MPNKKKFRRCKTCEKEIAKNATTCPHCGDNHRNFGCLSAVGSLLWTAILWVIVFVIVFVLTYYLGGGEVG